MRLIKPTNQTQLFCFSPPVMLATIIIELGLALFALLRYRWQPLVRLSVAVLVTLASFQLAEYQTCGHSLTELGLIWSRFGFCMITLLPPMGLHLVRQLSPVARTSRVFGLLSKTADAMALVFVAFFAFLPRAFNTPICGGNYVIFQLHAGLGSLYSFYYFGWLLTGLIAATMWARQAKPAVRSSLLWLAVGYLVFLLPTAVVNSINPATISGMASIMCGFAVFYAIILAGKILPLSAKTR